MIEFFLFSYFKTINDYELNFNGHCNILILCHSHSNKVCCCYFSVLLGLGKWVPAVEGEGEETVISSCSISGLLNESLRSQLHEISDRCIRRNS